MIGQFLQCTYDTWYKIIHCIKCTLIYFEVVSILIIYKSNFFIMLIDFTEIELETIANAMEDYINYDDELLNDDELLGGLSVSDRVNSINEKIDRLFIQMRDK